MDSTNSSSDQGQGANGDPSLVEVTYDFGKTRCVYSFSGRPPRLNVEHDPEKRVFRIAEPDGKIAVFRDEPVRFLVVTRNPRTGETMPALRYGEPEYLYLCREERERG